SKKGNVFVFVCVLIGAFALTAKGLEKGKTGVLSRIETPAKQLIQPEPGYGKTPLYFIPNKGQVNEKALFYAKTSGYTLWMTRQGLIFDSSRKETDKSKKKETPGMLLAVNEPVTYERDVSRLVFRESNKRPEVVSLEETKHRVNYFMGQDKTKWKKNIPTSKAVLYKALYKNIDLKVYGIEKQIEYDWIVKPGGRVGDIVFEYKSVKSVEVDKEGNLVITTKFGKLSHKSPISYQDIDGKRKAVEVTFRKIEENVYGFQAGDYDKDFELVIDPLVLIYSTYLGGDENDIGKGLAVNSNGEACIVGNTLSENFPVMNAIQDSIDLQYGRTSLFISKLSATGNTLVFSTYLGGYGTDSVFRVACDNNDCIYLTGMTNSIDFPLASPVASPPYQATSGGNTDTFISKLSANGDELVYSTYVGRSAVDKGMGLAVDGNGCAYVCGVTVSSDFPTTASAFDTTFNGSSDGFILKLSPTGTSLIYSTFIGGNSLDYPHSIVLDNTGAAYITGYVSSTNYPTINAFQSRHAGGSTVALDAFITKLNPSGSDLVFSTYLGGYKDDRGFDIAVDGNGYVYITGNSKSSDFPTTENAYNDYLYGNAFVTKLSADGSSLEYSTFFGGHGFNYGNGIAVDNYGCAIVAGTTDATDLPTYPFNNTFQSNNAGGDDVFIAKFSPGGSSLLFSTYLGGSGTDHDEHMRLGNYPNVSLALDNNYGVYISSSTDSIDFPIQNAVQATYQGGYRDAFVTKFRFPDLPPYITVLSPNGGEDWYPGETTTITWDYYAFTASEPIRLVLMKGGTRVGTIAENLQISTRSYQWTVGDYDGGTAGPGDDYRIRIETMVSDYPDQSDSDFTILSPAIILQAPNGGESWHLDETETITWNYYGINSSEPVRLILLQNGGIVGTIAENLTLSNSSFTWTVGQLLSSTATPGNNYQIRIETMTATYPDESNTYFTIAPPLIPTLTLTIPNGADQWQIGTRYTIKWIAENVTGVVNLELYKNDAVYSIIGIGSAEAGRVKWTIPAGIEEGDDYKIRIYQGTVEDYSDTDFSVVAVIPLVETPDFNGDGKADFLWRNTQTGTNDVWYMDGENSTGSDPLPEVTDLDVRVGGTGDFNNDGKTDILWRNQRTGENALWYLDGVTLTGTEMLPRFIDPDCYINGTGDFNGDGKPDILWRNYSSGVNAIWFMDGASILETTMLPTFNDPDCKITGTGDFNGDGKPDILWRNQRTGDNAIWYMNGANLTGTAMLPRFNDPDCYICGTGDFNGDSKPDIIWRNPTTGLNAVWYMDGVTITGSDLFPERNGENNKIANNGGE
ncbi:MAG: hypothetical protein GY757_30570, partial [bacterium]|nr:hypothetical protein [bacterium]